MWSKGFRRYGASLIVFMFLLFILYIFIGSKVQDIFVANYLFDVKETVYLNKVYMRGTLNWQLLKNHLMIGILMVYTFIFMALYISGQREYVEMENRTIKKIAERISQIQRGESVEKRSDYLSIDNEIKNIVQGKKELQENIDRQTVEYNQEMMFLAHDLKTPLTSVIGYVSLLVDNVDLPAGSRQKYLNIIFDSSKQLDKLIDQFFELSKYNVQISDLKKVKLKLNETLMQVQETLYPEIERKKLKIVNVFESDLYIEADSNLLARALLNIMKNAVKYSEADSEIITRTFKRKEKTVIEISNKARDIASGDVEKLFDSFFRGNNARTK